MAYLMIFLLAIRVFICEKVWPTAGIYFDISFCLCFIPDILLDRDRVLNRKLFFYPLIFIGLLLLNTIFSINLYNSQNEVLKFSMYMLIFIFVNQLDFNKRRLLIFSVLSASVIISLRAVYQYIAGIDYINQHYSYEQIINKGFYAIEMLKQRRVISWFLSPNLLAGYLLMTAFAALGYAVDSYKQNQIKKSIFLTAVFSISAVGLFLTRSWGAYLGFAATIFLIIFNISKTHFKYSSNRVKNKKLIVVTVALLLIIAAMYSNRAEYFLNINNPQNSLVQRLYYWQSAANIIKANPLTGVGLGNFGIIYPRFKNINANETIYAHNIFLQLWAELGTIIFLGLIGFMIYFYLNILKKMNREQPAIIGLNAAIIAFLVYNFFDFSFFVFQSGYVFFIIAACLKMPQVSEIVKKQSSLKQSSGGGKTILVLICGLMIFFLIREYNSQVSLDKADLFLKQGEIEEAISQADNALKYRSNNDQLYYFLAVCLKQKNAGKFSPDIVEFYQKAIDLNPNYAFYYYYLADYYLTHKFYPEAEAAAKLAVKHYPRNKKIQEMLVRTQGHKVQVGPT